MPHDILPRVAPPHVTDIQRSHAMLQLEASGAVKEGEFTGIVLSIKDKFGFIKQDHDEENMFVMPNACESFGGEIPPVGTRVSYDVVIDSKTGRPRADNVCPPPLSGTMLSVKEGKYGFIRQDCSDENMFVMPNACQAFGSIIPEVGTRVRYDIVADSKTGRPRAENVRPDTSQPKPLLQTTGWATGPSTICTKGPGKGGSRAALLSMPY